MLKKIRQYFSNIDLTSRNSLSGTIKPQLLQRAARVIGRADGSLQARWGSWAAEEMKHGSCCSSEATRETDAVLNATDTIYIDYFFLALHCLGSSYRFFLLAPKVKWEAAARSLLRASFLRTLAEGRASPPPLTTLTFRARCQPHLLTQDFASKGSSHHTDSSFEDASSFAYFLLPPATFGVWTPASRGRRGSPGRETSGSCIHIRPSSQQQILTASNMKNPHMPAQLALSQEIPHWVLKKIFISLLFSVLQKIWRQLAKTIPKSELSAGKPRQPEPRDAASVGKNLWWGKPGWTQILTDHFVLQKKTSRLLFLYRTIKFSPVSKLSCSSGSIATSF